MLHELKDSVAVLESDYLRQARPSRVFDVTSDDERIESASLEVHGDSDEIDKFVDIVSIRINYVRDVRVANYAENKAHIRVSLIPDFQADF
jgi:hypothetical protein